MHAVLIHVIRPVKSHESVVRLTNSDPSSRSHEKLSIPHEFSNLIRAEKKAVKDDLCTLSEP
jgi:hypothetical protein